MGSLKLGTFFEFWEFEVVFIYFFFQIVYFMSIGLKVSHDRLKLAKLMSEVEQHVSVF